MNYDDYKIEADKSCLIIKYEYSIKYSNIFISEI